MNKFLKLVLFVLLFYISKSVKLEIKVITYHDPPNIVISKGIYSGFLVDIFKSTVTQMNSNPSNNITYKFYETNGFFFNFLNIDPQPGYYDKENVKWTGLMNDIVTKNFDLALQTIPLTLDVLKVAKFSYSYFENCKIFIK
jgi:hypothetical protein